MKTIAYQGAPGAFSYLTAKKAYGDKAQLQGYSTFEEVYKAVEKGEADLGLLPIHNTLTGPIHDALALIEKGKLKVVGEAKTEVEQDLIGTSTETIAQVLSHPKALAQCTRLFASHPSWKQVPFYDTAGAVAEIAKRKDPTLAAIAHKSAAEIYGLKVLASKVQDQEENYTHFYWIAKA